MKLPFAEDALIETTKVTAYLLSPAHPQGRNKAAFFRRLGFRREHPEVLWQALRRLAPTIDVTETVFPFGIKYVGTGLLDSPSGRRVQVVTVWVMRDGLPPPILVTAYPASE
jgi:hypothetical protein